MTYAEKREVKVLHAQEVIRKAGFVCVLLNQQNGHLQCYTKRGNKVSYYPSTGTIAGYDTVEGLDDLLKVLEEK